MAFRGITDIDISVIVTAHHEGKLLVPCINSINLSIDNLASHDLQVEIIIVLDSADTETVQVAKDLAKKQPIKLISSEFGNPGEARNFGAKVSSGVFVSVIDGDDLVSSNWLSNAYLLAQSAQTKAIVHPEYIFAFGDRPGIFKMHDSSSGLYSHSDLIENNLWASPAFFDKRVLTEVPYKNYTAESGFGPEDWVWNIETVASGYAHLVAKGTVYLYRTSSSSGVNNSHHSSLLPEIPIYEIKDNLSHSDLEDVSIAKRNPATKLFRQILIAVYRICKVPLRPLVKAFPTAARSTYLFLRDSYAKITRQSIEQLASYLAETTNPLTNETEENISGLNQLTKELAWIDPQVSTAIESRYYLPVWEPGGGVYGELLSELIQELSEKQLNIVFVPWIGLGGADLVAINYVRALNELKPDHRNILIATWDPEKTNPEYIPDDLDFLQFDERYWKMSRELQSKLLAQLLICVRPEVIVNVNSPNFYDALRKYSKQISSISHIYTCVFCFDRTQKGLPVHTAFDGSRDYISDVSLILTDNTTTKNQLIDIFGFSNNQIRVHRSPLTNRAATSDMPRKALSPGEFPDRQTLKILWAHRFDKQKRPDILLRIVEECRNKQLDVEFHIYGANVMGNADPAMKQLENLGVLFHGTFTGGLQSVIHEEYDAFLITSEWEGLPTIAIQAIEHGLPIISSKVGGMPDLIPDSSHGFLIDSLENIEAYVDAIIVLQQNKLLRGEISHLAQKNLSENYRWDQFIESVSKDIINFSKEY